VCPLRGKGQAFPAKALSNEKQMVRGVQRWYVDFDRCIPVFTDHRAYGICLAVCPWAKPGVPMKLAKKMFQRIQKESGSAGSLRKP